MRCPDLTATGVKSVSHPDAFKMDSLTLASIILHDNRLVGGISSSSWLYFLGKSQKRSRLRSMCKNPYRRRLLSCDCMTYMSILLAVFTSTSTSTCSVTCFDRVCNGYRYIKELFRDFNIIIVKRQLCRSQRVIYLPSQIRNNPSHPAQCCIDRHTARPIRQLTKTHPHKGGSIR